MAKTQEGKCKGGTQGSAGTLGRGRRCSDLIMLLTAQTKGQLELDVVLRAAGRGLRERECEGGQGAGGQQDGEKEK